MRNLRIDQSRRLRALLLGSAALWAAAAGGARADNLADALASAVTNSARLEGQRQNIRAQDENVEQARAGKRPTITGQFSSGVNYSENSERFEENGVLRAPQTLSVIGTQTLYDGGQTENAVDGSISTVRSAERALIQTEQTVLLNSVTAYVSVLAAQESVENARNNVRVIGEALEAAQDRFEVGEVTRTDVSQAEARLAQARANLAQEIGLLNQERTTYLREIGKPAEDLKKLPELPDLPKTLEDANEIARRNHPNILAARFNVDSASSAVRQAQGALLPQIDAQTEFQTDSQGSTADSGRFALDAQITVTVPIVQGGVLRSQVYEAQAIADQRRADLAQTTREILEQVGISWENLQTARAQIRSNNEQVRAARVALEGVQEEAKVGARTTLDVLDAEQELLNAQNDLVDSRANEYIAAFQVLSSVGKLTVAHLNLDVPERVRSRPSYLGAQPLGRALPDTEDTAWRHNWRP